MFIADYHTHTNFSCDSEAPMEDMILSAIDKGLKEIAFTDHVDFCEHYEESDYNKYMPVFNGFKEKYADKIKLTFGVEIGLENPIAEKIDNFSQSFPFDFVIGSSHSVCGFDLYFDDFFTGKTKKEAYTIYFEEMLKNVKSINNFNVYGHMDFISRYGTYGDNSLLYKDYSDLIDEVLKVLIEKGKGIEINTSGYRYGINQTYPQFDILKRYKELGGEIVTVGSDSHTTSGIADHFEVAYDMLDRAGFKYLSLFRNRKPEFVKLP